MKQSFVHIMTLRIKHRYFHDGLFKSMIVSLSEDSKRLTSNLGILIKPFPGGFHILTSEPELPGNFDESEPLQFFFQCTDPNFINYTDLPDYDLTDSVLYFNNKTEFNDKTENGFKLHAENSAGENDLVQLVFEKINVPELNAGEKFRFTDAAGNEISSRNIAASIQNGNSFHIFDLPAGLIQFHSEKNGVKKFFHYSKVVWRKPFVVLELFPGKLFQQFAGKGKVEYSINFSNRKTIWKYFLVNPMYNKFQNLSIINKGKEQVFNSPQKQFVHPDLEAIVFESKSKIPLAEFSEETFQLVDNFSAGNGKGRVILKNLAKASPEQLYKGEGHLNEAIYSHIFI